eukprot:352282-Chlamydomonas_euryale.AAC.2
MAGGPKAGGAWLVHGRCMEWHAWGRGSYMDNAWSGMPGGVADTRPLLVFQDGAWLWAWCGRCRAATPTHKAWLWAWCGRCRAATPTHKAWLWAWCGRCRACP